MRNQQKREKRKKGEHILLLRFFFYGRRRSPPNIIERRDTCTKNTLHPVFGRRDDARRVTSLQRTLHRVYVRVLCLLRVCSQTSKDTKNSRTGDMKIVLIFTQPGDKWTRPRQIPSNKAFSVLSFRERRRRTRAQKEERGKQRTTQGDGQLQ